MAVSECRLSKVTENMSCAPGVKLHEQKQKIKQRFSVVKKLGQGTYGKVQLAVDKISGQSVAIKTIKKQKIETVKDLIRIQREIQIMSSIRHPHVIRIYEVFENREKIIIVMEYAAGGELFEYLSLKSRLTDSDARKIFRQIATACYHCHKHNICHRDLKLENILLDINGNAKIADFGLSNLFGAGRCLSTFCGSPLYASPEIVQGQPYRGPEVDCWSLGVLLYTLVHGVMPFAAGSFKALVRQISAGDYHRPDNPSLASDLIDSLLEVNTQKRFTIDQVCSHWWLNRDTATSCLNTAQRLSTADPVHLESLYSLLGESRSQTDSTAWLTQTADESVSVSNSRIDHDINRQPAREPKQSKAKLPLDNIDNKDSTYWTSSCRPKTFHSTIDQTVPSTIFSEDQSSLNKSYNGSNEIGAKRRRRASLFGRQKSYEVNNRDNSQELDQSFFDYKHRKNVETPRLSSRLSIDSAPADQYINGYCQERLGDSGSRETTTLNNHTSSRSERSGLLKLDQLADISLENNNVSQWCSQKQISNSRSCSGNSPVRDAYPRGTTEKDTVSSEYPYGLSSLKKYENKNSFISENRERSTRSYGNEQKLNNAIVERCRTYPSTRITSVTTPFFLGDNDVLHNSDNSSACSSMRTTTTTLNSSSSSYTPLPENETCRPSTDLSEDKTDPGIWSGARRNSHTYRMAAQWESILNADPVKPITLERPKRKLRDSLSIQTKITVVPEALRQTNNTVGSIRVTQARKMFEKSVNDLQSMAVPITIKKKCIILQDAGGLIPIKDDAGRIHLYSNESAPKLGKISSYQNGTLHASTFKKEVIDQHTNLYEVKESQTADSHSGNENTKKTKLRKSGKYVLKQQSNGIIKNIRKNSAQEKAGEDLSDRLNGIKDHSYGNENLLVDSAFSAHKSHSGDRDDYDNFTDKDRGDCLQVLKKSPRKMMMVDNTDSTRESIINTINDAALFSEKSTRTSRQDPTNNQGDLQEKIMYENIGYGNEWRKSSHENETIVNSSIPVSNGDGHPNHHSRAKSLNRALTKTSSNPALLDDDQTTEEPRTSTRRASYARDFISRFLDRSGKTSSKCADSSTPVLKQYTRSKTDDLRLEPTIDVISQQTTASPHLPTRAVPPLPTTAIRSRASRMAAGRRSNEIHSASFDQTAESEHNEAPQSDNQIRAADLAIRCQSEYWSQTQPSQATGYDNIKSSTDTKSKYVEPNVAIENVTSVMGSNHAYVSTFLSQSNENQRHAISHENDSIASLQRYAESPHIGHAFTATDTLNRAFSSLDLDDNDTSETSSIGTISTRFSSFENDEVKDRIMRKSYMPRFNVHRRAREPSLSRSLMYLYEDPVMETYIRNPQFNTATAAAAEPRPAMRPYGGSLHRRARSVTADLSTHARSNTLRRRSSRESVASALGQCDEHVSMWSTPTSSQLRRHTCYQLPIGRLGESADAVASTANTSSAANAGRACRLSKISENVLKNLELAATAIQHVRRRRQQPSDE